MIYHIICFTESWLSFEFTNGLLDPKGLYNIFRFDRGNNQPYGGVCVFIRKSYSVCQLLCDEMYKDVEIVALKITLSKFLITLLCSYFSPGLSNPSFVNAVNCNKSFCKPDK